MVTKKNNRVDNIMEGRIGGGGRGQLMKLPLTPLWCVIWLRGRLFIDGRLELRHISIKGDVRIVVNDAQSVEEFFVQVIFSWIIKFSRRS